jgi:ATP-dependent Clp protease adaptor protein ClpS
VKYLPHFKENKLSIADIQIDEKISVRIEEPDDLKVIFLNDDTTPMEFVIDVLKQIYKHTQETAEKITLTIHNEGSGIVGTYTHEIAESKANETVDLARSHGFQLQVRLEKV